MDAVLTLRRKQNEYHAKGNEFYMYLVDLVKANDKVLRKVMEWAMKKKGIPRKNLHNNNNGYF